MKGKLILIIFICTTVVVLLFIFGRENFGLVGPKFSKIQPQDISPPSSEVPSETTTPPNSPKTFQLDSSTDLKEELEKINPQVLESDFESLDSF